MDLRRQQISQTVEEVQKIIHLLTAEISRQDSRFEAVPVSDTHNESIKVSRALSLSEELQEASKPWDRRDSVCERYFSH